jgi:hypothetical protein
MDEDPHFFKILQTPQFHTYFLNLLDSEIPAEEKFQKVLDYFACQEEEQNRQTGVESIPSFDADRLLLEVASSVRRAIGRLKRSQHQDGGWGSQVEKSTFWDTAYAMLCLGAARGHPELTGDVETTPMMQRGYAFLEQRGEDWAADAIEPEGALSVYRLCLMTRCFFQGGREFLRRETVVRVYRSIEHLYHAQNEDGGWDASLWGYAVMTPTRLFSEVSSTGAALNALTWMRDDRFIPAAQKAVKWLVNMQNADGSWSSGSMRPDLPPLMLTGDPRFNKTCEALQGILAVQSLEMPLQPYRRVIQCALSWLCRSEQPVLAKPTHLVGWGWGYTADDYENICLMLETLFHLPDAPQTLLASHAAWLVQCQHKQDDDVEDGSWVLGHTARIANTLIEFYRKSRGPEIAYSLWLP